MRWSQRGLADALGCNERMVRHWAAGGSPIPAELADWLERLASVFERQPAPTNWRQRAA